ncbi:DUF3575 domain-containing protein [Haliscomenobacter sp.]|uniref:DUF3575 domain-containing protein n=1 Tax=Haliscomenobacter sp. TaxID=2717303 RepID=UPI003365046E
MQKNYFFIAILCLIANATLFAQVDVKIGPFGPIFGTLNLRSEFGLADNIGLEATLGGSWNKINFNEGSDLKNTTLRAGVNGRYYFNPSEIGLDKFYGGLYTRYSSGKATGTSDSTSAEYNTNRFAAGFLFGFKTFARNERLHFDFNLGFGRAFVYNIKALNNADPINLGDIPFLNIDLPITIAIGYRF